MLCGGPILSVIVSVTNNATWEEDCTESLIGGQPSGFLSAFFTNSNGSPRVGKSFEVTTESMFLFCILREKEFFTIKKKLLSKKGQY